MHYTEKFAPILNKFHLVVLEALILLILLLLPSFKLGISQAATPHNPIVQKQEEDLEVIVNPLVPNIGNTISVKIKKTQDETHIPKVFFDKTKIPVFVLSNNWYRSLVPLSANHKAGKYPLEIFYRGFLKRIPLVIKETRFPLEELTLTKEVAALKASRIEKALVAKTLSIQSSKKLWTGKFIFPSDSKHSTLYGVKRRINGVIDPDYFHKGLDFTAALGDNIKAPENGKVILVGQESKGFVVNGNCVFLDHGHSVITGYLHLQSVLVKEGDLVKKGQIIGKVGSTGIASGPHLHWGVYVLGKTVDPINWTSMTIE